MGTITISIDDEVERKFRERVKRVHGERKGALGQAATEALDLWVGKKSQEEIAKTALALMETTYNLGTWQYTSRDDLYGRTNSTY